MTRRQSAETALQEIDYVLDDEPEVDHGWRAYASAPVMDALVALEERMKLVSPIGLSWAEAREFLLSDDLAGGERPFTGVIEALKQATPNRPFRYRSSVSSLVPLWLRWIYRRVYSKYPDHCDWVIEKVSEEQVGGFR